MHIFGGSLTGVFPAVRTSNGKNNDHMIVLKTGGPEDIAKIREIAYSTWPVAFRNILSAPQIDYMLKQMYSAGSLENQMKVLDHRFLLALLDGREAGFCSFQIHFPYTNCLKIHKLYILPDCQQQGIGRAMMQRMEATAKKEKCNVVTLNVNRYNEAVHFYKSQGFEVSGETDIPIGEGYLMEDYLMEKRLTLTD